MRSATYFPWKGAESIHVGTARAPCNWRGLSPAIRSLWELRTDNFTAALRRACISRRNARAASLRRARQFGTRSARNFPIGRLIGVLRHDAERDGSKDFAMNTITHNELLQLVEESNDPCVSL